MKRIFALPLLSIILFSACSSHQSSTSVPLDSMVVDTFGKVDTTLSTDTSIQASTDTSVDLKSISKPSENSSKWKYEEEEDKMTSRKNFFASIDANEQLEFAAPYNGGSTATLSIRKKGGETNIYLRVDPAQFMIGIYGTTIRARFDKAQPIRFDCSSASDGSADIVFINNTRKMISKLKASKRLIIEAEFYQSGVKQMEFDVTGFKWNH